MIYLMLTFIVLCQNGYANCTLQDIMKLSVSDIFDSVMNAFNTVRIRVKNAFNTRSAEVLQKNHQPPPDREIKTLFTRSFERITEKSELPVYKTMKSEPTVLMSTPQLALHHGKRVESHRITTKDGYILTIHRIIASRYFTKGITNQTVILHHGLLGSSADWLLLGPTKSLPYLLCNIGYDVWLTNSRGNDYSRAHEWTQVDSNVFWQFSWQEIGKYDLRAVINYIRSEKNFTDSPSEKIDFIGHSMGATALLVLLSTSPEYNDYLRMGVLMAPLVYMTNAKGPLKLLKDVAMNPPQYLFKFVGIKEFVPTRKVSKWLALNMCNGSILFCSNPLFFISGGIPEDESMDDTYTARLSYNVPAGGSTQTIWHYLQLMKTGKFHMFNNTDIEFNLTDVTLPIALISSDDDWLATVPDVQRLYDSISNPLDHYIVRLKKFSHTDFAWGHDANNLVFNKVLKYLLDGLSSSSIKNNEINIDVANIENKN